MKEDDQRAVVCGGDPENYLKAYFKGLYFDMDDKEEIKIIGLKEKFSMGRETIEGIANKSHLTLFDYSENGKDIYIYLRK